MNRIPSKLEHPPLHEAVFEVRFTSPQEGGGELLPGMLFSAFHGAFSNVEPTPAGIIPKVMRQEHPFLKYAAQYKLQGVNEALLIGDNVLSLNVTPPYPGWARFRSRCVEVATALQRTGVAGNVERYSLKYINHLPSPGKSLEKIFNIRLDLGGYVMTENGFALRFETLDDGFLSIVECQSAQTIQSVPKSLIVFSIDTIRVGDLGQFWTNVEGGVDSAHRVLEDLFFGLISPDTLKGLGPIWE